MTHLVHPTADLHTYSNRVLGFWTYLMADSVLFFMLITTFLVLHTSTFGGPPSHELFELSFSFIQTLLLLVSSFIGGLSMLAFEKDKVKQGLLWMGGVFLFGAGFLGMELYEFSKLVMEGDSWARSAFLSSYFTLVGTHGLHITTGLIWLIFLVAQILHRGITPMTFRRLVYFNMFWHFLDLVWIFLFTIVYLMGAL